MLSLISFRLFGYESERSNLEYSDALAHPCHSFLKLLAFIPLIARQIFFFPDSVHGYVPKLAFDARIGRYASAALVVLVLIVGIVALSPYVYADTMGNTTTTGMNIATNGTGQIELARFTAAFHRHSEFHNSLRAESVW